MKKEKIKSDAVSTNPSYKSGNSITDSPPWTLGLFGGLAGLLGAFVGIKSMEWLLRWLDKKGYIKEGGQIKRYLRTHSK